MLSGLPTFPAARGDDDTSSCAAGSSWRPAIDAMERAFDAAEVRRSPGRPVLEATIPSLADPSLVAGAPAGTHVMSVIVQ